MSLFRYLSPKSLSTMSQMEKTIIPVSASPEPYKGRFSGRFREPFSDRCANPYGRHYVEDYEDEDEYPEYPEQHQQHYQHDFRESYQEPYKETYHEPPYHEPIQEHHPEPHPEHYVEVVNEKVANTNTNEDSNQRRNQFRPRVGKSGTASYQLRQYAEVTLGGGSLRKVVKLPEGEDENEWLAVNMVDFYNQINLLYGAITEFCSPQSCPEMKATDEFEYLWQDNENYKRPTKMPAPAYIEQLMTWVQSNIDNEQVLPSKIGVPFPKSFPALVRQIFKRMYRVYAHIYCHHYPVIRELGLEPHLNTSFKQYVLFVDEHSLASGRDYWGPLGDLVDSMLKSD